jgi:ketosteroid isomerase-like protein
VSQKNVDLVRAAFVAYNAGDLDRHVTMYSPDAVFVPDASVFPEAVSVRGRDEIRAWLAETARAWASPAVPLTEVVDVGDNQVLTRGEWGGRGAASGIELHASLSGVWTIRNGAISRVEWFFDDDKALEAVAL